MELWLITDSAAYVMGRNNFRSDQRAANVGRMSFGFMWAAMACLFLSTVLLAVAGVTSKKRDKTYTRRTGGRSFFGRRRAARDRGSFIDTESQRRVKDEYN